MSEKTETPSYITEHDGYADVKFRRKHKIEGAERDSIKMREPTVEDLERYQDDKGTQSAREIKMIANLCELPPDEIRKLPVREYARLQETFALFTN